MGTGGQWISENRKELTEKVVRFAWDEQQQQQAGSAHEQMREVQPQFRPSAAGAGASSSSSSASQHQLPASDCVIGRALSSLLSSLALPPPAPAPRVQALELAASVLPCNQAFVDRLLEKEDASAENVEAFLWRMQRETER